LLSSASLRYAEHNTARSCRIGSEFGAVHPTSADTKVAWMVILDHHPRDAQDRWSPKETRQRL